MATRFHLRRQGLHWGWALIDEGDTPEAEQVVLAKSPQTYPSKGEAEAAISQARRSVGEADTVVDTTVPTSRWRPIAADGTMGEPIDDDPPDNDDEGETGPPEMLVGYDEPDQDGPTPQ